MNINGNELPSTLVTKIISKELVRNIGCWELHKSNDSFGNKLETEIGLVFRDEEELQKETDKLKQHFVPDGFYGSSNEWKNESGYIEDITDFTKTVCFATSADDSPFCLDYRYSDVPSVIWWDDVYWRKISQTIEDFFELFEFNS